MDDRFDRRELLLHLGDILAALNCLAGTNEPGALVAHLVRKHASLQDFAFLKALAPKMTVAEFSARAARSFFLWPTELLEAELNRDALASTVQHNLFDGNPDGWNAYIGYVQKKVKWFGTGLSNNKKDALAEPSHDAPNEAGSVEAEDMALPAVEVEVRGEKRGWPWPEPSSTS
ncbi:hypothetical protein [Paraburkholderia sediminicola]|uniref:hypothetical protein n=1 Tax=Paraburkholderia sediminicola TaxID=458836 RepID=UPI0038B92DD4